MTLSLPSQELQRHRLPWRAYRRSDRYVSVSPADVRFTQDSINKSFFNGERIATTMLKFALKVLAVDDIEPIRVMKKENFYYSVDNRRLYLFRVLHLMGLVDDIPAEEISEFGDEEGRFTTKNDGCHLFFRGPGPIRHCGCEEGKRGKKRYPVWWNIKNKSIIPHKLRGDDVTLYEDVTGEKIQRPNVTNTQEMQGSEIRTQPSNADSNQQQLNEKAGDGRGADEKTSRRHSNIEQASHDTKDSSSGVLGILRRFLCCCLGKG